MRWLAAIALSLLAVPAAAQIAQPTVAARPAIDTRGSVQGQTVLAFLDALRANDAAAVQKLLAPGFVMPRRWKNCFTYENDRQCFARFIADNLTSMQGTFVLQKLRVERNIVRINIALTSRSTVEEGASRILLTDEFVVEGGKIESFIRTPRTEDPMTRAYFLNRHQER